MGRYGKGGENKTHHSTKRYSRIDSHTVSNIHRLMGYDRDEMTHTVQGTKVIIKRDCVLWDDIRIPLDFVSNGFGGNDRVYFICPACRKRYRYLYDIPYKGRFLPACRKCAKLNYPSQQRSHGWEEATQRALAHLRKMGYDTRDLAPCDIEYIRPPRPKGQHETTYRKNLIKLLKLQEEQRQETIKMMLSVLGKGASAALLRDIF